MTPYMKFVA